MGGTSTADWVRAFRSYLNEMDHYREAVALMEWDLRTGAPRKGVALRSEAIGTLSDEVFRRQTGPQMAEFLDRLEEPSTWAELDPVTQAVVVECRREFERNRRIPAERKRAFVTLTAEAETVWAEAKEQSEFALFAPYLERIVQLEREFAGYWGDSGRRPYDTLLDLYEPGLTTDVVDALFAPLREETVRLLGEIVSSGIRPDVSPLCQTFDIERQRALNARLLRHIGYDFEAGRMDPTVHPFQTTINRYDARITTMFVEDDLRASVFSTIHEGGHALYEQGIHPDLTGTPLATGTSMGMHESQSRFFENMIGRSQAFWVPLYADLQRAFPQLKGLALDAFHAAVNCVEPSLIRIDADEVTYNLHIMLRYELEKALIEGELEVADLPGIWREKMESYLGISPPDDAHGVLQDVHWSGGLFGYFPSYALGNLYAAQLRHALLRDVPSAMDEVASGNLAPVLGWMREHVHQYGKLRTPREILRQATGEDLNGQYLVDYFWEKFTPIYHL
ncbi:MAG: carboxypeptidase M32 [Alicyclobacillus sp.]|nr:carboxypeptidase M32 [Alicyclobacillus sp.]